MSWTIHVGKQAVLRYRFLDPSLQAELREHVAAVAESPRALLTRSTTGQHSGLYTYAYHSALVVGLVMTMYFDGFDDDPPRLDLIGIAERTEEPP